MLALRDLIDFAEINRALAERSRERRFEAHVEREFSLGHGHTRECEGDA